MKNDPDKEPSFRETESALRSFRELLDTLKNSNQGNELSDKLEEVDRAYATLSRFMRFLFEEVHDYNQPDGIYPTYAKQSVALEEIERKQTPYSFESKPIFIIGAWRSGTTLVSSILDAHATICAIPENELCRVMLSPTPTSITDFISPPANGLIPIVHAYKTLEVMGESRSRFFHRWSSLVHEVYCDYMQQVGKKRWVNKFVDSYQYLDLLDAVFGYQSHYLFVMRHGLDAASSASDLYGRLEGSPVFVDGTLDIRTYLQHWVNCNDATLDFCERNASRCQYVTYEALVEDPERSVNAMLDFLGEERDPGIIERIKTADIHRGLGDPKIFETAGGIDPSRQNRWNSWPQPLLRQLARLANPTLQRLGYAAVEAST